MAIVYLKQADRHTKTDKAGVTTTVTELLARLRAEGEAAALDLAQKFDQWTGEIVLTPEEIATAVANTPEDVKRDIQFAHDNIRRFAQAQLDTISSCAIEIVPGFTAGQRLIPITAAGCYVPGGRYNHVASALMTITTAKTAGVKHITAVSPPHAGTGIAPATLYAMALSGADRILNIGGVQAIATMAFGLFGCPKADILVGPGNAFVAEAKRLLFGEVGIDMIAGPTDSLVIADDSADPELVALDLVGQAEHGYNSPVWLITDDEPLAHQVMCLVPTMFDALPEVNAENAKAAWRDYAEVILCATRDEMLAVANDYAPEHLHVQARDLDWWLQNLTAYGSLFLGEETTVAFGDKASGPNHVLPTCGAARYTGGLSVHKFLKAVTWQQTTAVGMRPVAEATARIARIEGMEGHARTADARLKKYFGEDMIDDD